MLPPINKDRPASLSLRVTAFVGITTTVCLIILGYIVQQSIELHFLEQDAEELQVVVDSVRTSFTDSYTGQDNVDYHTLLETAVSGHHGVYFMVEDASGRNLYSTPGLDLSAIVATAEIVDRVDINSLYRWAENGQTFRGAVLNLEIPIANSSSETAQQFVVAVAATMDFHMRFMESFNKTLWGVIAAASLITVLAAWFAVLQGHAPLRNVSSKIRGISSDQLHLRLDAEEVPRELAELVSSFNDMIERIEDVFDRLSNFSADIAHEIRTPITNITTQTEVALSKARSLEEYQEILYSNLEEYERMTKMVNDLLMLAKTDSGLLKPMFAELDLCAEIGELFDYFEAWTEEKGISLKLEGKCRTIQGDRSMIMRALSNLLSNAIRNTSANKIVTVSLRTIGDSTLIGVTNPGTEIPADHLPRIFDRFYRISPSNKGEGAGLGLAIVKSIVDIHNGEISVNSDSFSTTFSIQLPSKFS